MRISRLLLTLILATPVVAQDELSMGTTDHVVTIGLSHYGSVVGAELARLSDVDCVVARGLEVFLSWARSCGVEADGPQFRTLAPVLVGFDEDGAEVDMESLVAKDGFPVALSRWLSDAWSTQARAAVSGSSSATPVHRCFDADVSRARGGVVSMPRVVAPSDESRSAPVA